MQAGTRASSTPRTCTAVLCLSTATDATAHTRYVYAGGLAYELTEGDVLAVFSQARAQTQRVAMNSTPRCLHVYAFSVSLQYGEIVDVNLVRDRETGKSKGFAFIAFEDQRSTVLAVDNLSGARVVGRTVRVEHVDDYKLKRKEARRAGMCVAVERQH